MVKLVYVKTTSAETEDKKLLTLHFNGTSNGVKYELKIGGDVEDILFKKDELKLLQYNQMIDIKISNEQANLDEFNEKKD